MVPSNPVAAKRSPILGYNHNVRYRGLVFHVQTEDSGVMSPHLFTHMFHGGVIVSTRKLVYDAGSAEDSIKSLMQAQHKAVLKDLKRGQFDDKIDEYLGSTPGLLPRGAVDVDRPSMPEIELIPGVEVEAETTPLPVIGAPTIADLRSPLVGAATIADVRASTDADAPSLEPPPPMEDPPTLLDTNGGVAAGIAIPRTATDSTPEIALEIQLEVDDDRDDEPAPRPASQTSPPSVPRRASRDTEVQLFADASSDGIPRAEAFLPVAPPPLPPDKRIGASSLPPMRQPTRPPARPAMIAPTVVSRPVTRDDSRERIDSDAIEVYAPPPASVPDPPGVHAERPGQYSLRRGSQKIEPLPKVEPPKPRERSGPSAIPAGLARPGRSGAVRTGGTTPPGDGPTLAPPPAPGPGRAERPSAGHPIVAAPAAVAPTLPVTTKPRMPALPVDAPVAAPRVATPALPLGSTTSSLVPPRAVTPPVPVGPRAHTPSSPPRSATQERARSISSVGPERARTATPAQYMGRTPTPARVMPPSARANSPSSSGVVMTRPAVIVGAPAKPTQQRVRKASEEGRGFGQGLISEKSLDEVILAYLSEDAEDK